MPVMFTGFDPNGVAGTQFLHFSISTPDQAKTSRYKECLT